MSRYTSPHDEPWFSDPDQPWGGSHKRIDRDPDVERDRRIDDERLVPGQPAVASLDHR